MGIGNLCQWTAEDWRLLAMTTLAAERLRSNPPPIEDPLNLPVTSPPAPSGVRVRWNRVSGNLPGRTKP